VKRGRRQVTGKPNLANHRNVAQPRGDEDGDQGRRRPGTKSYRVARGRKWLLHDVPNKRTEC
jgi:hypothetical protein